MTNGKERTYLTMVSMALLVMVLSISSSTQAMALGHWNPDGDYSLNRGLKGEGAGSPGTIDMIPIEEKDGITAIEDQGSDNNNNIDYWAASESEAYEDFQRCLSSAEREDGSYTQQEMQGCYESNLEEDNTHPIPIEDDGDGGEYENGTKEDDDSANDTQDEE